MPDETRLPCHKYQTVVFNTQYGMCCIATRLRCTEKLLWASHNGQEISGGDLNADPTSVCDILVLFLSCIRQEELM